jgi:hypothetical protein
MGSRRSKHNKGRKPIYKDHRLVARDILARPQYFNKGFYSTGTWWKPVDVLKIEILCEANSNIEMSAEALGRCPSTLVQKARDLRLMVPREWSRLLESKRPKALTARKSEMAYPFINSPRTEHAELMEVNALIPRSIPDNMRADMCQEIMLAILEGRTTIDALRARSRSAAYFIRKFYHENFEQNGHALSFSTGGEEGDESRSYDEIAASIAAKDWHHEKVVERQTGIIPPRMFTPPNQFEAAWLDQIGRTQLSLHELGEFLSREEVEEMLDEMSVP